MLKTCWLYSIDYSDIVAGYSVGTYKGFPQSGKYSTHFHRYVMWSGWICLVANNNGVWSNRPGMNMLWLVEEHVVRNTFYIFKPTLSFLIPLSYLDLTFSVSIMSLHILNVFHEVPFLTWSSVPHFSLFAAAKENKSFYHPLTSTDLHSEAEHMRIP